MRGVWLDRGREKKRNKVIIPIQRAEKYLLAYTINQNWQVRNTLVVNHEYKKMVLLSSLSLIRGDCFRVLSQILFDVWFVNTYFNSMTLFALSSCSRWFYWSARKLSFYRMRNEKEEREKSRSNSSILQYISFERISRKSFWLS